MGDTYPIPPGTSCLADGVPRTCTPCTINVCAKTPSDETCPTCPAAGKPIALATGNTFIEQTDLQLPGLGGGLALKRTWNSKWPLSQAAYNTGIFGVNWRSTFEESLFVGSDGTIKYSRSDGSFWSFAFNSFINQSGVIVGSTFNVAAPADQAATLSVIDPNWTITFENGEKRVFQANSGKLTSIVDRNGNTTQLAYDNANRLVTVADPAGRHLSFTYSAGAMPAVVAVSVDVGVSLTYSYDGVGRLVTVTKPDQTSISMEYDSNSRITAVKDSAGKLLEGHTYDSLGRGLTSTRANGVDAITISYPQ